MLKFFYDAYFDPNGGDAVNANKTALEESLKKRLVEEQERNCTSTSNKRSLEQSNKKKQKVRTVAPVDPKLAEIQTAMWGLVAV